MVSQTVSGLECDLDCAVNRRSVFHTRVNSGRNLSTVRYEFTVRSSQASSSERRALFVSVSTEEPESQASASLGQVGIRARLSREFGQVGTCSLMGIATTARNARLIYCKLLPWFKDSNHISKEIWVGREIAP